MPLSHPFNWTAGWSLILASFVSGAFLGLFFHRAEWWGGYASLRRRMARLGHIAFAALGMLNILFAFGPLPVPGSELARWAGGCLAAGGALMPLACFATAWRTECRFAFPLPVALLAAGVVLILVGGLS